MEIKKKNLEGEPENVCTEYNVHTIALVKNNALGMNILKAKAKGEPQTEEMNVLTDKINKAKALDEEQKAEDANKEIIEKAKAEEKTMVENEDISTEGAIESGEGSGIEKAKAEEITEEPAAEEPAAEDETPATTDKAKAEDSKEEDEEEEIIEKSKEADPKPEEEEEPIEKSKVEDGPKEDAEEDPEKKEDDEATDSKIEKKKSFTIDELADSIKSSLSAVGDLFKKVKGIAPSAEHWEIFDIIYNAIYTVDDIMWFEKMELENQIWEEISSQVGAKLEKAKALEVKEATNPVDVMKALESMNPEMAKVINAQLASSKAKAKDAEAAKDAVIRQKALESGAHVFKRIATDDNTTANIVDALSTIEVLAPEAHAVVTKALQVSSNILQAGELFPDVGSSMKIQHQGVDSYVEEKSKALVEKAKGEGDTLNPAAARATVRQSPEFMSLYG